MTQNEGGPSTGQDRAKPTQGDRGGDNAGITGNAAVTGEEPSPGDGDRGEASEAGEPAAIDLDAARDRAS